MPRRAAACFYPFAPDALWLNATVENLLAITKLEGGGMRLSTTLELMDDIVEEALRYVNPAVREHDLKVVACDEPALVKVDARLMVQLVVNLVNNAITYTPAGSHIMISISVDDGRVACSVADDGPGIAPEDRGADLRVVLYRQPWSGRRPPQRWPGSFALPFHCVGTWR